MDRIGGLGRVLTSRAAGDSRQAVKLFRTLLVGLLFGVLAPLIPLAYAIPTDPVWIGGVYDDADLDEAALLIIWLASVVDPFPLDDACPVLLDLAYLHQFDQGPAPSGTPSSAHARAPPDA